MGGETGGRDPPDPRTGVTRAPSRRATRGLAIIAALIGVTGWLGAPSSPPTTTALMTEVQGLVSSYATDTLSPPTSPGVTGGTSVTVSWTPTPDLYAAGYLVSRATASSGPFVQVGTQTPRSATSYVDTPSASGTYWYVLNSYLVNWTSAATTPVSAAFDPGGTGFKRCSAQAADTGGDGNGYEGSAANGCQVDTLNATDANSGSGTSTSCTSTAKDRHRFSAFALGVPGTATAITGITVQYRLGIDLVSGTNLVCAQLSWDGGATWTTTQSANVTATALTTYTLGGPTNTWGRTWTIAQLSDANFRLRLINVSNNNARDFRLDGVEVQVNYTP
ncbi:MAG: uncharacterized protein HW391_451 [Chloroflexi bacterium]|nr:uncharacterized protein [Chloroflexota bacterium]